MKKLTPQKKQYLKVYFDTETFNQYVNDSEEPIVVPYLIGACTHEPNTYRYFRGINSTSEFLKWLFHEGKDKVVTLIAFNLDYDFWAIFPQLKSEYPDVKIRYKQCGDKKFISGSIISSKRRINISFRDLWVWDKSMSLDDYYEQFKWLAEENSKWKEIIQKYGLEELEKLSLTDYHKSNMYQENGKLFYFDKSSTLKELDEDLELKYLKNDVTGLPLIHEYIDWFKVLCSDRLQVPSPKAIDYVHSIPSFGKYLLEQHLKKQGLQQWRLRETFKIQCSKDDYVDMNLSYFGGFSGVNKWLPVVECEDAKIKSYDVNSEYPWVMWEGVPYGDIEWEPPKEPYCTWYEIYFEKQVAPGVLYRYKPKYDIFNNDFFGKNFFASKVPGWTNRKMYVLKEVLELFERVCDCHVIIDRVKYQRLSTEIRPFIETLYEIKSNKNNPKYLRNAVKLVLNSFYGKLGERFHEYHYELEGWEMVKKHNNDEDRWSILPGLYITSKSRVKLLTAVYDEVDNGNIVLCSDTDSIKMIEQKTPKFEIDSKKLGAWKFEGEFTGFYHVNKCKKYYSYNKHTGDKKLVFSGIPEYELFDLSHEDLKKLYYYDNNVLFRDTKNASYRNEFNQIVIRKVDICFNAHDDRPITHMCTNNQIYRYGEAD